MAIVFVWSTGFFTPPEYQYRFRLTVDVDVDGAIRSGSSVIHVSAGRNFGLDSSGWYDDVSARGEAVYVDLGGGRNLFALLWFPDALTFSQDQPEMLAPVALKAAELPGLAGKVGGQLQRAIAALRQGSAVLDYETMPLLVSFVDMGSAHSARFLTPSDESFARVFGPGVRFRQARIELVDPGWWFLRRRGFDTGDPINDIVRGLLPWLASVDGPNAVRPILQQHLGRTPREFNDWAFSRNRSIGMGKKK